MLTPPYNTGIPTLSFELGAFLELVAAILVLWFINMAITGWLARRKGRDGGVWAVIAIFTGPIALIAILLNAKKDPIPESEAARLELAPPGRVHLVNDSELELDVAGRLVRLKGKLAARIKGRPNFEVAPSAEWRWSDGASMTDDERAHLLAQLPSVGKHEGWTLTLDAGDLAPVVRVASR